MTAENIYIYCNRRCCCQLVISQFTVRLTVLQCFSIKLKTFHRKYVDMVVFISIDSAQNPSVCDTSLGNLLLI